MPSQSGSPIHARTALRAWGSGLPGPGLGCRARCASSTLLHNVHCFLVGVSSLPVHFQEWIKRLARVYGTYILCKRAQPTSPDALVIYYPAFSKYPNNGGDEDNHINSPSAEERVLARVPGKSPNPPSNCPIQERPAATGSPAGGHLFVLSSGASLQQPFRSLDLSNILPGSLSLLRVMPRLVSGSLLYIPWV